MRPAATGARLLLAAAAGAVALLLLAFPEAASRALTAATKTRANDAAQVILKRCRKPVADEAAADALPAAATSVPRQRVLVAIATDTVRSGPRLANLWRVIDAYRAFPEPFDVTITVDTLSPSVVSEVQARYPSRGSNGSAPLAGCGRVVSQLWNLEDLLRIRETLQQPDSEPVEYLLTHVHRSYFRRLRYEYDVFVYSEDDMLLDFPTFSRFRELQAPLWSCCSFLPGLYRFENKRNASAEARFLIDTDAGGHDNSPIYVLEDDERGSRGGRTFFIGFVRYFALWVLDASQLREFAAEPGGYFDSGPAEGWGYRERMAFGYNFGRTRSGLLEPRVLVPFDPETRTLDRRFGVHHLSDNYVNDPRSSPRPRVEAIAAWQGAIESYFVPLRPHASHPCTWSGSTAVLYTT
jgi:hypothetical protein